MLFADLCAKYYIVSRDIVGLAIIFVIDGDCDDSKQLMDDLSAIEIDENTVSECLSKGAHIQFYSGVLKALKEAI